MTDDPSRELAAVRRALDARPREADVERLFPLIVPESYLQHESWPGPHAQLRAPGLVLVWVVTFPDAMVYLDRARTDLFERSALDWRSIALANLRSATRSRLWTHAKRAGDTIVFASMMHEDGLGSSRVLLAEELGEAFPQGYRVAIPERSCGIVIPSDLSPAHERDARGVVRQLFERGTVPVSERLYGPEELRVRD